MAKKRKTNTKKYFKSITVSFWLMWSMLGGILFSFGFLSFINESGKSLPIVIGAVMIIVAIFLGKFKTETSVAMGRK